MHLTAFRSAGTKPLLAALAALAVACAGKDGGPGATGADGKTVLLATAPAPASECPSGGVQVDSGLDANASGALDAGEVRSTVYVCDGADGASAQVAAELAGDHCGAGGVAIAVGAGAPTYVCNGATGATGQAGESVTATPEAAGENCENGGTRLQVGTGTPTYVCTGATGATGQAGLDGESVSMTPEPIGDNCRYGGEKLQVGTGTATYVCNGAPGATGATGQDGQSVTVTPAPEGACTWGGQMLQVGGGTPTYVCNGEPGATGLPGQDGQSVVMTPELAGDNCQYGGQKLQVGASEPTYVCNGQPGASGMPGQDGLSVTMTPEPEGLNCVYGGVKLQVGGGPESYLCSGAPVGIVRPTVATAAVSGVRYAAASVEAAVTASGGELVYARGVVIATHAGPTLDDTIWISGAGTGAFTTLLTELDPATAYFVRAFATNAVGTSYGEELSFTTLALTTPTLATRAPSNVTTVTALSGGDVVDDGGSPLLDRGICWDTMPDPVLGGTCSSEGPGAPDFLALASALTQSTTYHVRAYAVNAQGTSYGDDQTFTTVALPLATLTTTAPSAIAQTTATGGGSVTADNGAAVTTRGICWSTSPSPTTAGSKYTEAGGLGSFTASMTGLVAGTTYYVRAFAVSASGTSYGNERTFTTLAPAAPTIATRAITGISSDVAGSGGTIASDGGSAITAKGVCWSLNPGPTTANSKTTDGSGPASFNSTMTLLVPLTTYYVRAYATNALGTTYGAEVSFTTTDLVTGGPTVPTVGTTTTAIATSTTATSGGLVSSDGGSPVTARGVCWSTSQNPALGGAGVTCSTDGTGKGFFASTVTGIGGCAVQYYVRAYATNTTGTGYGVQAAFSTGLPPTLTTAPLTIGSYGFTSGGTISDDGGCPITARGVVWSATANPTTGNSRTTDGTGAGTYVSTVTGLLPNRAYYMRAYATSAVGTVYGAQEAFTTTEPPGPYVGRNYGGGVVFYVDGTGEHGLITAAADQGGAAWGCQGISVPTGSALGTGASNTAGILGSCAETGIAARVADNLELNGYLDWYLPSQAELLLIYDQLNRNGRAGGLNSNSTYWSSTQVDANNALTYYPYYGWQSQYPKATGLSVRAIRAF